MSKNSEQDLRAYSMDQLLDLLRSKLKEVEDFDNYSTDIKIRMSAINDLQLIEKEIDDRLQMN
jgi:hypothetical protein